MSDKDLILAEETPATPSTPDGGGGGSGGICDK